LRPSAAHELGIDKKRQKHVAILVQDQADAFDVSVAFADGSGMRFDCGPTCTACVDADARTNNRGAFGRS
jgi:hypothetical protein